MTKKLTVITPTTGKRKGLSRLIASINRQKDSHEIQHILMWDDFREEGSLEYYKYHSDNCYSIYIPGDLGKLFGSHLRSVAMMAAQTEYVTFADDDVWWEDNHYETIKSNIIEKQLTWGGVRRNIWNPNTLERIGTDNFESVGYSTENINKKVDYEMLDGNCMVFKREYGVYAAPLYREVDFYGDDRLLYDYLKENAPESCLVANPTINQLCPVKLINMFETYCDSNI